MMISGAATDLENVALGRNVGNCALPGVVGFGTSVDESDEEEDMLRIRFFGKPGSA